MICCKLQPTTESFVGGPCSQKMDYLNSSMFIHKEVRLLGSMMRSYTADGAVIFFTKNVKKILSGGIRYHARTRYVRQRGAGAYTLQNCLELPERLCQQVPAVYFKRKFACAVACQHFYDFTAETGFPGPTEGCAPKAVNCRHCRALAQGFAQDIEEC